MKLVWLGAALILLAGCAGETGPISNYAEARSIFWRSVYPSGGETLYCKQGFQTSDRRGVNIEHVFPMSWVTNALNCGKRKQCRSNSELFNLIEADLHNLYPSRSDVNQQRSSFRFGEVRGEPRRFGSQCDFEVNHRARVVEPAPEVRGEVARAMFYMAYQYRDHRLEIFKKQARLLLQWHQEDPPSELEKRRNDVIEKLQGSRNLFIDQPERLEQLMEDDYFVL